MRLWTLHLFALTLAAQTPSFEVASIRPGTRTNTGSLCSSVKLSPVKVPPNTRVETCRKMLQNLLAERFHLVTTVEIRDVPRYYLKVSKSGLKLKPVSGPPADLNASSSFSVKDGVERHTFRGASASRVVSAIREVAIVDARVRRLNTSTSGFRIADVVDETGLTGYYDGTSEFVATAPLHDEFSESLSDGLTLELRKAPGKILVLSSSDRMPTEN